MKEPYLEVTFRNGQPVAAYFHLPRGSGARSYRTVKAENGMVVDFTRSGKPIGIEITAPSKVTLTGLNRVLRDLGMPPAKRADLAPLKAA